MCSDALKWMNYSQNGFQNDCCHEHTILGQGSVYDVETQSGSFNSMLNTEFAYKF